MVYIPPSQSATKPRARSSAPKPGKYKNKKILFRGESFDSIGERDRWIFLLSEQEAGRIRNLKRQERFDFHINGEQICYYLADFVYEELVKVRPKCHPNQIRGGENNIFYVWIVEDFKGVITDVFTLKAKMFKATYGYDIKITKRPSWRSSNALEGKSWKHS